MPRLMLPSPRGKRRQERLSVTELLCSHQQLFITSLSPSLLYSFSPFNLCVCHSLPPSHSLHVSFCCHLSLSSFHFLPDLFSFLFWVMAHLHVSSFPPSCVVHPLFSFNPFFKFFFAVAPPPMSLILCPFPLLIYFCLWSLNFFLSPSFPFFFPYSSFPFSSLSSPRSLHLSPHFPSFPSSIRLSLLLCPLFSFLPYSLSHTDPSSHLSHPSPFCLSFPSLPFSFSSHVCLPSFLLSILLWFFPFLIIFLHTSHTYVHLSFLNSSAHISSFPDSWHPSSLWCSFLLAFL